MLDSPGPFMIREWLLKTGKHKKKLGVTVKANKSVPALKEHKNNAHKSE